MSTPYQKEQGAPSEEEWYLAQLASPNKDVRGQAIGCARRYVTEDNKDRIWPVLAAIAGDPSRRVQERVLAVGAIVYNGGHDALLSLMPYVDDETPLDFLWREPQEGVLVAFPDHPLSRLFRHQLQRAVEKEEAKPVALGEYIRHYLEEVTKKEGNGDPKAPLEERLAEVPEELPYGPRFLDRHPAIAKHPLPFWGYGQGWG